MLYSVASKTHCRLEGPVDFVGGNGLDPRA